MGACLLAGGIGGALTSVSLGDWYEGLAKPPWNPPNWVFGPVWTTLYILMGVAAWLVWRESDRRRTGKALTLFAAQLFLNVAWSGFFFTLQSPLLGFIDIVALWSLILATTIAFSEISRPAAALMLPYLLWVSYALTLNFAIWRLNG